ncbi:hypothetical protein FQN49_001492 [Arthroderma sp. PD_2]|nr:hypothetical protein FQN49_001492 [Arthroderma sp. PD_2]
MDKIDRQFIRSTPTHSTSIFALRDQDALKEANITHVISVVGPSERSTAISSLHKYDARGHLILALADRGNENILQHFPQAVRFIQAAIADGGAVLVHCGLGVSRSATIVIAYMLYHARSKLTPGGALFVLRSSRPGCQPNPGLTKLLALYHEMGCPDSLDDQAPYQQFLKQELV